MNDNTLGSATLWFAGVSLLAYIVVMLLGTGAISMGIEQTSQQFLNVLQAVILLIMSLFLAASILIRYRTNPI